MKEEEKIPFKLVADADMDTNESKDDCVFIFEVD